MTHRNDSAPDRIALARACYRAYEAGDREAIEALIAPGFRFWSPVDEGIDRAAYFERCWPNHEHLAAFRFVRLVAHGDDEVLVTYEAERDDGTRFRNTEVMTFAGDRLTSVEVYFGWNL
jgi:ketosteroid isomerase-like protein